MSFSNTDRIDRTVDNMLVCRTVLRSVLSSVTGRRRRAATVCHRGYRPPINEVFCGAFASIGEGAVRAAHQAGMDRALARGDYRRRP
jgi:hypothetical protein